MENLYYQRVEALRHLLRDKGWDAVIISGSDPHASEYVASRWHQVEWLSGYNGEGSVVVTADHAGLWTDTRYFIQAGRQLPGTGIELHKMKVPEQVPVPQWLREKFGEDPVVAVDGQSIDAQTVHDIVAVCRNSRIVNVPDLLDAFWEDRPAVPCTPIITLGEEQTGWSRQKKLAWLRRWMEERGYDAMLVAALDEIAWLLNVRGSDVAYNPVVMSYLLVTAEAADWFVVKDGAEADDETADSFYELRGEGIGIRNYQDVTLALSELAEDDSVTSLFVDPSSLNYSLYYVLKNSRLGAESAGGRGIVTGVSPIGLRKAVKNATEIAGMREAHLVDGVAMEKFFCALERKMTEVSEYERSRRNVYDSMLTDETGPVAFTERDAAMLLHGFRAQIPGFRGESFETISAYGENAALPHYVTPEEGGAELKPRGLYLVDSGGQFLFGTTDITRTVPLGPCSQLEAEDYTLVLKGHIDLAMAVFPKGSAGCQIDALAREPMWRAKRDFGHGTGHGVGSYLNVHEGPQDIRQNFNRQPILPGMITSNEPGIYREGQWGIRHENLVLCVGLGRNDFGDWLGFETLTLCHIDTSIIVRSLLGEDETAWLNAYNARVCEMLSPHLPADVAEWLKGKTQPI